MDTRATPQSHALPSPHMLSVPESVATLRDVLTLSSEPAPHTIITGVEHDELDAPLLPLEDPAATSNKCTDFEPLSKQACVRERKTGIMMALFSSFLSTMLSMTVRYGSSVLRINTAVLLFMRGAISLVVVPPLLLTLHRSGSFDVKFPSDRSARLGLVLRGVFGACAQTTRFFCLSMLPISEATAIMYTSPAFTVVIEALFLGEQLGACDIAAACLSACGVGFIAVGSRHLASGAVSAGAGVAIAGGLSPATAMNASNRAATSGMSMSTHLMGLGFGIASAFFTAIALTTARKLRSSVHVLWNVFSLNLCSMLAALALLNKDVVPIVAQGFDTSRGVAVLVSTGLLGIAGVTMIDRSVQLIPASTVTVIRNVEIIIAFAIGALFLSERSHPPESVIGSCMIMAATIMVAVLRMRAPAS